MGSAKVRTWLDDFAHAWMLDGIGVTCEDAA
jgi:hypothetical protein